MRITRRPSVHSLLLPAALAIALLAPLIALGWYTFNLQRQAMEESYQHEINGLAETLANGMVEPIWTLIPQAGQPLVDSLMQDPRVLSVSVISFAQDEFLNAAKDDPGAVPTVTLERQVLRGGEPIGTVRLRMGTGFMFASMQQQWQRIMIAGGAQAVVALAVAFLILSYSRRIQRTTLLQDANRRLNKEVEERREAQAKLEDSRDQLRLITDALPVMIVFMDQERRYRFVNKTCADWYARDPEEILGKRIEEILDFSEEYRAVRTRHQRALNGERLTFRESVTFPDGVTRVIQRTYLPHHGSGGRVTGILALGEDVTNLTKAAERRQQSQKLEAVGQLTGGVAHDFNNLLAVIQGNAELLAEADGPQNSQVNPIIHASERGAELTRRLLAFSRQQPLTPRAVDLAELVSDMSELLTRTLGETIEIELRFGDDPCIAKADPGQVESALLNLCINARDAMPSGGNLTIECDTVVYERSSQPDDDDALAGEYVVLSVTDTGTGMSPQVKARAFEPFFTTKDVGCGSGLGLSIIYGFAKQSGGRTTIQSEQGSGTTVTLCLPGSRALSTVEVRPARACETLPHGRGERVLVIEDEPGVRSMVVRMLDRLGYSTFEVSEAAAAREVLASGKTIDLILSDVVLPNGMSGPEFAAEARGACPALKTIFMSGYPADAAKRNGLLHAGVVLLNKPFRMNQLADALRKAFDT